MKTLQCFQRMLMILLIAGVALFAYAGRDVDDDGPMVGSASTKKNNAKIRAYANANGGYYKYRNGAWSLTAVVPNQITKGESSVADAVQFNSTIYESLYHRGRGHDLSDASASAYCTAETMGGTRYSVHAQT